MTDWEEAYQCAVMTNKHEFDVAKSSMRNSIQDLRRMLDAAEQALDNDTLVGSNGVLQGTVASLEAASGRYNHALRMDQELFAGRPKGTPYT